MKLLSHSTPKISRKGVAKSFFKELYQSRYLYLLMLPAIVYMAMFSYRGMYGLLLAFKEYHPRLGIMESDWIGFKHFIGMFTDEYFIHVLFNTIKISFGRLLITYPFPLIIALAFNEIRQKRLKKTLQTVYTFPHFLSWVIFSGLMVNMLSLNGPVNAVLDFFGGEKQVFLGNKKLIIPILYITDILKEAGWSCILYLAAITSISQELYEVADLDGASRLQKIWHVTLPSIRGTILVVMVLGVGQILNGGFDQIFNMSNTVVQQKTDILDTYIYRITFQQAPDFSYSVAVGMFKSVVGFLLVMTVNKLSARMDVRGILD